MPPLIWNLLCRPVSTVRPLHCHILGTKAGTEYTKCQAWYHHFHLTSAFKLPTALTSNNQDLQEHSYAMLIEWAVPKNRQAVFRIAQDQQGLLAITTASCCIWIYLHTSSFCWAEVLVKAFAFDLIGGLNSSTFTLITLILWIIEFWVTKLSSLSLSCTW